MTISPSVNVRWLLDQLEDPFTLFPIESVAGTLFEAVDVAEMRIADIMGSWEVARKFWSVEAEHYHEEVGLLVGAIFVLGQACHHANGFHTKRAKKSPGDAERYTREEGG